METRANYVAVGFFTMLVIASAFAFIYWVSRFDESTNLVPLNVRIEGSVTGLGENSDVLFNGIKVGQVQVIRFDPDDPRIVNAIVAIKADTPVRSDTRASLGIQGLTGVAYISLKGGTPQAQSLLANNDGVIPTIDADESAVTDILETVRDVAARVNSVAGSLEGFVNDNREPLTKAVANLETFSESLSRNAEGVDKFLASVSDMSESFSSLSGKLDGSIEAIEGIVSAVDPEKVRASVDNVADFTDKLSKSGDRIDSIIANADEATKGLNGIVAAIEADDVKTVVANVASAAESAKTAMADLQTATSAFSGRKEEIDKFITDASQLAERLNAASVRVDGVLAKLDGFLGTGDAGSVMTQINETVGEFRALASNLNTQVNQISQGLTRFSDRGLRDVETLVNESRRSVQRIERLISNIESDPQRFLFGGDEVRQYRGQRPRR